MAWWEAEGGKVGLSVALVDPPGASPMVELKLLARDAFADPPQRRRRGPTDAGGAHRTAAPAAAPAAASQRPSSGPRSRCR